MKEISVSYAVQVKHCFCTSLNVKNLLMPSKKTSQQPNIAFLHCFRTLVLQTAHFLLLSLIVCSNKSPDSLVRTSKTGICVFLLCDGEQEIFVSDIVEVFSV